MLAGMLGVCPDNWTFHGLQRAVQSKIELEWWHTSHVVAACYNGAIPRKDKRIWVAADFHPMSKSRPKRTMTAEDVHQYRSMCKTHTVVSASEVRVKK